MEYPELAARTGSFRFGAPHAVTVSGDGERIAFLRSEGPYDPDAALWVLTVATGDVTKVADGPVASYAGSCDLSVLTWATPGGELRGFGSAEGPVLDPRPDPTGQHVGFTRPDGSLWVDDQVLAGEPGVTWGMAETAAEQFGRTKGWWWSPDGSTVLAVRKATSISLHLLDLYGGWVDVHWDRETYPYLADVRWTAGNPLITVLRRSQQHGLVLSIDPRTGETQVHAELADARWVEPVAGTPLLLPDGRVLVGGELAHDGFDARCLFADGSLLTPPGLYVRRVAGVLPDTRELIIEGTEGEPAEQHVYAIRTTIGGGGAKSRRLTSTPGWHHAVVGGDVLVIDDEVRRGEAVLRLPSERAVWPYHPNPVFERVTDRRLPAAVLHPSGHVHGSRLPVLLDLGAGPGHQHVTNDPAAWQERQWWADAGFVVVSADSRGTPGVAPSFEKVVHRRLADVALTDQIEALHTLTGKHPDLDLSRVAVRGTGLGGWLAALAVQRRPDVFRCGIARDPVLRWSELPPAFAERYLGPIADNPEIYEHHNAAPTGPALLVLPAASSSPVDLSEELQFVIRECA
ncbi:prolyl oligopeptidase family serine peptidase [Actinoplanes sp. TFC3]|uniref:prolyl oligopeptidase family serine peptidase n=1 Tax=Actinoplanes sp. TFC3 TaxID=1710355 RepID=UPI001F29334C|nr:prolyl oligopeptidase family serine peptidase [Actinoplanes sp. TFC3]